MKHIHLFDIKFGGAAPPSGAKMRCAKTLNTNAFFNRRIAPTARGASIRRPHSAAGTGSSLTCWQRSEEADPSKRETKNNNSVLTGRAITPSL